MKNIIYRNRKYDINSIPDNNTTLHRLKHCNRLSLEISLAVSRISPLRTCNIFPAISGAKCWDYGNNDRKLCGILTSWFMVFILIGWTNWTQSRASEVHSLPSFSNSAAHTKYYQKCNRNMTNAHLNLWFAMLLNPGKDITRQVNKACSRDHGIKCQEKIFHYSLEL
jgi:hypothetical protein